MPVETANSPVSDARRAAPGPAVARSSTPSTGLSERRIVCMVVRQLTAELLGVVGDRAEVRRARRRASCHVRQISMYVCHVALSMPYGEIAEAFGVDRTTVSHACHVVEDRRDDAGFDTFVSTVERLAEAVCMVAGRQA
ncbi:helix-turn-helix domain-containing protein [Ciceribacter selenitireducens]|uniref:helix-turn-helix domain-containing protein n=1 Tax=Ciceribacter selenitireducens TaxID=448181 RepID=UPI0004912F94|nr:helix-turn-helix domain-containing protein [Ciceribacter selenitireducens]